MERSTKKALALLLGGAHLDSADLLGADLTDANGLTWEQLKLARKDNRTRLPASLLLTVR